MSLSIGQMLIGADELVIAMSMVEGVLPECGMWVGVSVFISVYTDELIKSCSCLPALLFVEQFHAVCFALRSPIMMDSTVVSVSVSRSVAKAGVKWGL